MERELKFETGHKGCWKMTAKILSGGSRGYLYISVREGKRENKVNVSNSSRLSVHCHWEKVQDTCLLLLLLEQIEWIGCEDLDGFEPLSSGRLPFWVCCENPDGQCRAYNPCRQDSEIQAQFDISLRLERTCCRYFS